MRLREIKSTPFAGMAPAGLLAFMHSHCDGGMLPLSIPQNGMAFRGGVCGASLVREGDYQIELVMVAPGVVVPAHSHPGVNSIEVMLAGGSEVFIEGVSASVERAPRDNGMSRNFGLWAYIPSTAKHWGKSSDQGFSFLSIQHWSVPMKSIGMQWEGPLT